MRLRVRVRDCVIDKDGCEAQSCVLAACGGKDIDKCLLGGEPTAVCATRFGEPCVVEFSGVCAFVTD